ncbi:MAG: hypothetical protein LBQ52_10110 [Helicobacteraceae bacterium]|jgi:hypothetical protein|nr:hypothetical protein [Helicobacteraceae bacterium]
MSEKTIAAAGAIVKKARQNEIVYLPNEWQIDLEDLDELVFKRRSDLVLKPSAHLNDDRAMSEEEMDKLTRLKYVKKLDLGYCRNLSFKPLADMKRLTYLNLWGAKSGLDISFIEELSALDTLYIQGKIKTLKPIETCRGLKFLYLSTRINNFDFIKPLDKIEKLCIDYCASTNDFAYLNKPSLKALSITQVKALENIDSLSEFQYLEALALSASRIKKLPDMSALCNLRVLELKGMASLENIEALKTIPKLERLSLQEINTKIKAEEFYFLAEINSLKEVDTRFLDLNKGRIKKITDHFIKRQKAELLKR